jgi:hypothetical protein
MQRCTLMLIQPKEGEALPSLSFPSNAQIISSEQAARALREQRVYLSSDAEQVFVHDGTVNSGVAEATIRNITDDPALALFLRYVVRAGVCCGCS